MKNIKSIFKRFSLLLAVILIATPGCKKDHDNDSSSSVNNGSISAIVDGVNWNAISTTISATRMNGHTVLSGKAADSTLITITVNQEVAAGSYDLGMTQQGEAVFTVIIQGVINTWASNSGLSTGGTITVTSIDTSAKRMTGTFNFTAYNTMLDSTKTFATGVFTNLKYETSISGTGNNSFSCKIDGVDFNPNLISGSASFGTILISASDNGGLRSVGLNFPDNIAVGTYAMDGSTDAGGGYNPNTSTNLHSVSGSLVISSHNTTTKKIVGSFNFVAEPVSGPPPSNNITNGSFTIYY
jgi:hypothetical protein